MDTTGGIPHMFSSQKSKETQNYFNLQKIIGIKIIIFTELYMKKYDTHIYTYENGLDHLINDGFH